MPQFGYSRNVWVYLPPDYNASEKTYPVLYMQDGQNLFEDSASFVGEWRVDETLDSLFKLGDYGCIVVGVENGRERRMAEYTVNKHQEFGGGEGNEYVDYIINNLKPYIDSQYRTKPEAVFTGIGGSSLGALISYYAATKHSDVFGKAMLFSPSFWIDSTYIKWSNGSNTDCYFLAGEKEDGGDVLKKCEALRPVWFAAANGEAKFSFAPDGEHKEWFWAREFGPAYLWLFGDLKKEE